MTKNRKQVEKESEYDSHDIQYESYINIYKYKYQKKHDDKLNDIDD